jgi:hypothetical protein
LREIESTLLFMFEAKEYIEEKATRNYELNRRHTEIEKAVEKARKQARYEKKRKAEEEMQRVRQAKIENRTVRAGEISKNANLRLRHSMFRSEKAKRMKKVVEQRHLTEQELDFMRYVGDDPNRKEQTIVAKFKSMQSRSR